MLSLLVVEQRWQNLMDKHIFFFYTLGWEGEGW